VIRACEAEGARPWRRTAESGSSGFAADACHLARFSLPGALLWDQIVWLATNFQCRPFEVPAPQAGNSVQERQMEKQH